MPGGTEKRWILPEELYPSEWERIAFDPAIPAPGLTVLWNRGLRSREDFRRFVRPEVGDLHDPFLLGDVSLAVDRLVQARKRGERILVFGDSDVDGITATVLWARMLGKLGYAVVAHIPNRMEDGFGLTPALCERAQQLGATLIVANDCGTTAHQAGVRAGRMGIDVLVADHHLPDPEIPSFSALVNPHRRGDGYPFPDLAAVGVAFKILQGLVERTGDRESMDDLLALSDLVALGTIADQVSLQGENRTLVRLGLERMRNHPRPCLQALAVWTGEDLRQCTADRLARLLIPRVNACGRLGVPEHALDLLMCDDPREARVLADVVEDDNRERRLLTERLLEEAQEKIERDGSLPMIVQGDAGWHPGVLGIAASRMAEVHRVPVVLVATGGKMARGSARGRPKTDLPRLFSTVHRLLSSLGGHPRAMGFSLPPERFAEFRSALLDAAALARPLPEEETLLLEGPLDPLCCDLTLGRWLEAMAPFGMGNPEPFFFGRGLCHDARVEGGRHLRLRLGSGEKVADGVGFGLGARAEEIPRSGAWCELAFRPIVGVYRGRERLQLKLLEFRFAQSAG